MADRNLLDVTHFMCARLTAMCELMDQRKDWTYGGHVIYELSSVLKRMPFTDEEGAFIHRTLEPLITTYGSGASGTGIQLTNGWMVPLIDALVHIPGKPAAVVT